MTKAERIEIELRHERAAIWYISDQFGSKVMIKIPATTIKALMKGCKMELLFGRDETLTPNVFHLGVRIYDDPVHYQVIACTQRFLDEHLSLARIMHLEHVQIQLYNELNICQAFGTLIIKKDDKHNVHALLGNPKKLRKGIFDKEFSYSLDRFQSCLDSNSVGLNSRNFMKTLVVQSPVPDWEFVQNNFLNENETINISIADVDEGGMLEKEVFITLRSLFDNDLFQGPRIPFKNNTRELTDILAFSNYGIFMVEAKALGVTRVLGQRTMDRKVLGLQKQIEKATKQLVGAAKRIKENEPIYDSAGREISFDRTLLPHGIILISEMLLFGNWDQALYKVLKAMTEFNIWIHVMDLKEFMQFVGYAKGDKNKFDYLLGERIKAFVEKPSFFIQTHFVE